MKKKKVVDPRFSKGRGDYEKVISQIADEAKCPFCPDNFRYHKKPILKRHSGWFITESSWPYKNTKFHFLILGDRHAEKLSGLSDKDWTSITWLAKWAVGKFKIKGGGLVMRFGETLYTGASVCHLHAHLIVPKLNHKTKRANPVSFLIG